MPRPETVVGGRVGAVGAALGLLVMACFVVGIGLLMRERYDR